MHLINTKNSENLVIKDWSAFAPKREFYFSGTDLCLRWTLHLDNMRKQLVIFKDDPHYNPFDKKSCPSFSVAFDLSENRQNLTLAKSKKIDVGRNNLLMQHLVAFLNFKMQ